MIGPGVLGSSGRREDLCRRSPQDPERCPANEGETGDHRLEDCRHETVSADPKKTRGLILTVAYTINVALNQRIVCDL